MELAVFCNSRLSRIGLGSIITGVLFMLIGYATPVLSAFTLKDSGVQCNYSLSYFCVNGTSGVQCFTYPHIPNWILMKATLLLSVVLLGFFTYGVGKRDIKTLRRAGLSIVFLTAVFTISSGILFNIRLTETMTGGTSDQSTPFVLVAGFGYIAGGLILVIESVLFGGHGANDFEAKAFVA